MNIEQYLASIGNTIKILALIFFIMIIMIVTICIIGGEDSLIPRQLKMSWVRDCCSHPTL